MKPEQGSGWEEAEAKYQQGIAQIRHSTRKLRGGPETGHRIAELFEEYTHDLDLSANLPKENVDAENTQIPSPSLPVPK